MSLRKWVPFFAVALVFALAVAPATARAASRAPASEQQRLVNMARTTFVHFLDDPNLKSFREHQGEALGYLIVPKAVRVGLVFGGSGGGAVLIARNGASGWNGPAFYKVGTASFGAQLGVDVSEIVVLVMTHRGMDALMSSSVKPGLDASVAAGPVGVGVGRTPRLTTDFIYYSRSKGLYGGATFEGAMIRPDRDANDAYYGRGASPRSIIVRGSLRNPGSRQLIETLDSSYRVVARR